MRPMDTRVALKAALLLAWLFAMLASSSSLSRLYSEIGKVVGGTKGNFILEYVSGAPNKESRVENPPNAFDYDELAKYGYGNLATPIMKAGGRFAMYELLGLDAPAVKSKPKQLSAPDLVIDRTGESDPGRYSGLKLGQVLDDDAPSGCSEGRATKVKRRKEDASKN